MKQDFIKFLLNFSLFFGFLCPYFKIRHISINSAYLFIMLPAFVYLFEKVYVINSKLQKRIFVPIVILGITFLFALVNQCLFFFVDFTLIRLAFVGIFIYFSSNFYVEKFKKIYGISYKEKIIKNFINTIFINSLISILCIFVIPFRDIFYSFIDINDLVFSYRISTRFSGFVFTGFSFLSTVNSFAVIFLFVFIFDNKEKVFSGGIKMCTILLHIFFLGRTGIITFFVGLSLYFILLNKTKNKKQVKNFNLFFLTIIPISLIILSRYADIDLIQKTFEWAFEIFINFIRNGSFSTSSTDELLKNHFILPENLSQLCFGTGFFSRDFVDSDIGYIQILTGGGIFILFSCYLLYFVGVIKYFLHPKSIYSFFLLYMSLCIFVVNFKDLYYISYTAYTLIYFIILTIVSSGGGNECDKCVGDF